ncbi:MAG: nitroreductase family protein [Caulobacterales bacterium]
MRFDPASVPEAPATDSPNAPSEPCLEMLALMARRRSSKPFHLVEPGPSADQIAVLLRLATRVPDHGKLAPWRFLVIAGDARQGVGDQLAAAATRQDGVTAETIEAARTSFTRSACCIGVISTAGPHAKIPVWEQHLSAGAVSYGLLLAAEAMGFGAVWLTGWPAYDAGAKAALGVSDGEQVAAFIHIGTQAQTQTERPRPNLAQIVRWL